MLRSKQLAQGSQVDLFEKKFGEMFNVNYPVSVNSGTSALETAYDLLHLGEEDEVISTPLTCVATNMPLLHRRCKIVWADIRKDTLTLDREDVERKITPRTKAIVNVHLGGIESSIGSFYLDGKKIPTVADSSRLWEFSQWTMLLVLSKPSNTSRQVTAVCWCVLPKKLLDEQSSCGGLVLTETVKKPPDLSI